MSKNEARLVDIDGTPPTTEESMRAVICALGGLLVGLLLGGKGRTKQSVSKTPPALPTQKNPFVRYQFNCWLCSGRTFFDGLPHMTETQVYDQDCKWCGMPNRVEIQPTCKVNP